MASGPDLFVVCRSCGREVSPYITECPYCGKRLRKRAPKLERGGTPKPPKAPRKRPSLGRLKPGEMPGIRGERRPYATIVLVLAAIVVTILFNAGVFFLDDLALGAGVTDEWWRTVTTLFVYTQNGYEVAVLAAVFLFGWLLERRHGPWAPLLVFFAGGAGGMALAIVAGDADLRARRQRRRARAAVRLGRARPARPPPRRGGRLGHARRARDRRRAGAAAARRRGGERASRASAARVIGLLLGLPLARHARALDDATIDARARPARRRPTTQPSTSPARSGATAASSPPEVIASQTSRRRGSATPSAKRREASPRRRGCGASRRPRRARRRAARARRRSRARRRRRSRPRARSPRRARATWPSRPKPVTSVSALAPAARACSAAPALSVAHHRDRALHERRVREPALERGRHRAGAERLGQHERVAVAAAGVGEHGARVDDAGHREPVLGLGVVDRVPADDRGAGRGDGVGAAAQDLAQHLRPERLEREGDEVQRRHRPAAHRVDVRERVGGGDPPERVRVVDDRREEVGGLHDRDAPR